ncbi:class II aldolase/adducin family protein [Mycolicibacterium cosmeticum]|uniref:class II aldolase/adducin family protein n=1 Tax=Mycolicibacterium cosmeticum TaxID=258533 RepID=UPI0032048CCC
MNRDNGRTSAEAATDAVLTNESPAVRDQKIDLAAAFRIFGRLGFDLGVAGHITARHAEDPELFWVNPLGRSFNRMRACDLQLVDGQGRVVHGGRPINHSAYVIHSHIHRQLPAVNAVAHAHSPHGVAWSSLGRTLEPINQNACVFFDDQVLFDDYFGPVLADDEGAKIASALAESRAKAAVLVNHGVVTVGGSVAEAAWWFIAFERAAQVALLCEAAATRPRQVAENVARDAHSVSGTPRAGVLAFQPLRNWILHEEPDLVD